MSDLIDRQAAIDALENIGSLDTEADKKYARSVFEALPSAQPEEFEWCTDCKEYDQNKNCCHRWTKVIRETLEELKQAQPDWIPCSERFPEVGSEVLVCYDFNGKRSVYIADFYGDGDFHGLDDEYLTAECRKNRKAVAWMPLPAPYKAESEE